MLSERNMKLWPEGGAIVGKPITVDINKAMDAARAEGEEAGVVKAERAAADHIAKLEYQVAALIWYIPGDVQIGSVRATFDRLMDERSRKDQRLVAADLELDAAIERTKRAENEAFRFEALQVALDTWARENGSMIFATALGNMRFPRRSAEATEAKIRAMAESDGRPIPETDPLIFVAPALERPDPSPSSLTAIQRQAEQIADGPVADPATRRTVQLVAALASIVKRS